MVVDALGRQVPELERDGAAAGSDRVGKPALQGTETARVDTDALAVLSVTLDPRVVEQILRDLRFIARTETLHASFM